MVQNGILLQDLTPEQLGKLFDEKIQHRLEQFKKDIYNQKAIDELLTRDEACAFLKIDSSTLWAWTNKGNVIAYGIGSRRYYKRSELLQALTILKK